MKHASHSSTAGVRKGQIHVQDCEVTPECRLWIPLAQYSVSVYHSYLLTLICKLVCLLCWNCQKWQKKNGYEIVRNLEYGGNTFYGTVHSQWFNTEITLLLFILINLTTVSNRKPCFITLSLPECLYKIKYNTLSSQFYS